MENNSILNVSNISKTFPGVKALEDVDFNLRECEVHGLVGENGAGKSTLIKIISGVIRPDSGHINILEREQIINNPHHARSLGIATVFQELSQVPTLSVAENIFLGQEYIKSKFVINRGRFIVETSKILNKFNIELDPGAIIDKLSQAKKQLTEIVKAISQEPKILILDEPSSSLSDIETESLFKIIEDLKKNKVGIIYISHRMDEIFKITDRVTVLRDGKLISVDNTKDLDMEKIVSLMVGRSIKIYKSISRSFNKIKEAGKILQVKHLAKKGIFNNISFDLYKGEILGIAGLVGSGRSELVNAIFGAINYDSGKIIIDGSEIKVNNVKDALKVGVALIPESRQREGLILMHSVERNIVLPILKMFSKIGILNYKETKKYARNAMEKLNIIPKNTQMIVANLSGGNQQKVSIAKWLTTNPKILIVDEPTMGIDVRTKSEIHKIIKKLSNDGISIIMISSEMEEILKHCDRVMVMNKGRAIGIFKRNEINQKEIMSLIIKDNLIINNK